MSGSLRVLDGRADARIVRAVDDADTATSAEWAPEDRPVRPSPGVCPGWARHQPGDALVATGDALGSSATSPRAGARGPDFEAPVGPSVPEVYTAILLARLMGCRPGATAATGARPRRPGRPGLAARPRVRLSAAYLQGSAVLGGWPAAVSDVDVLVVIVEHVEFEVATTLADTAAATAERCPGTGLEQGIAESAAAARPRSSWTFVAHGTQARSGETNCPRPRPPPRS